jgi:hypothetical protein
MSLRERTRAIVRALVLLFCYCRVSRRPMNRQ